jgi:flagellar motility protein MotE (MotC chaperone)
MKNNFNDIIKKEQKISFSEFRDFVYEIDGAFKAQLSDRDQKIKQLETTVNHLNNSLKSNKQFYNSELTKVLKKYRSLDAKISAGFKILEKLE